MKELDTFNKTHEQTMEQLKKRSRSHGIRSKALIGAAIITVVSIKPALDLIDDESVYMTALSVPMYMQGILFGVGALVSSIEQGTANREIDRQNRITNSLDSVMLCGIEPGDQQVGEHYPTLITELCQNPEEI